MNPALLLTHFECLADAPDAIPRLRRFILDLAVRGKLVPQDPADEPASELLKRIAAEIARLVKAGEFREPRSALEIERANLPFRPPPHWRWARLIDIARPSYGFAFPSSGFNSSKRGMRWSGSDALLNQRVMRIRGWRCGVDPEFVKIPLQCVLDHLHGATSLTTVKHLSAKQVNGIEIPLPPLAEQHRIVAKVNELMALCDRLEAARKERESRRDRLVAASLHRLSHPDADGDEAFQVETRFYLNHLPRLTTRPEHIKQLRQTILNLAVRGRLVPQDPADEPASGLLNAISKTRQRLYAGRKIPKPKTLPLIDDLELPFDVPPGWAWSMLGELCYQVSDGPHYSPHYVPPENGVPFLSTRNVRTHGFDLGTVKYVSRADHHEFCKRIKPERGDIIYTKGGTTGIAKVNDLNFEFSVWVHLAVLRIEKQLLFPRYVEVALNSPHCYEQSQKYTQGTSNFDLGLTRMIKITVPLPPLAEQHRIVAKVDELMALCDRLEASLVETEADSRRLLEAVLHEALEPAESTLEAAE